VRASSVEHIFDTSGPGELIAVIEEAHRQESKLIARKLAAVAALLWHRMEEYETDPGPAYATVSGAQRAAAEVAAAMNLSPRAASFMVSYADTLKTRLPRLAELLAEGRTDWRTVELVINRTDLVQDSSIDQIDRSLAARVVNWRCWSRRRIINAVDAAVRVADPDAARERRLADDNDRHIDVTALPGGAARVSGQVAAAAAAAFDQRLSALTNGVCARDPRSLAVRRADALAAMAEGRRLACRCGADDCPARSADDQAPAGARVVVNVVASEEAVTGRSQQPGYLSGFGVIAADQVRDFIDAGAALRILEPTTTLVEALRYQPSAALERWVRCRDLTCRFPGCDRRAEFCDVDHTVPFNHADPSAGGLTVATNLKCLCRIHHRLKTFHGGVGGWRDEQLPDGTIVWTSPMGQVYRTTPGGADLFAEFRKPACGQPTPRRRNHARDQKARIARARKRNRSIRPVNDETRRVRQARKNEIEARKFRNHMRDMLFLFKGKPSTSPFCAWVNDPYESEELPPDWQPPPRPPEPPDDPPY